MIENPQSSGEIVDRDAKGRFIEGHRRLGGRARGVKNFDTIFDEALKKIVEEKGIKDAKEVDLVLRAILEARAGNFNYYKDILDRRYGKPKESVELGGEISHNDNKILDLLKDADKETRKKVIDGLIEILRGRDEGGDI